MSADVIALPAPPEAVTTEEFEQYANLAGRGYDVWPAVWRLACPELREHPEELQKLWERFCEAARLRDGLAHGSEWWTYYPEEFARDEVEGYDPQDQQDQAVLLMAERADEARMEIIHGPRGGN